MRTIRRNATRVIAQLKERLTTCRMYDASTGNMVDVDSDRAWHALDTYHDARLIEDNTDKYTVAVHTNYFFRLSPAEPTADTQPPAPATTEAENTTKTAPATASKAPAQPAPTAPAPATEAPTAARVLPPDETCGESYYVRLARLALEGAPDDPMAHSSRDSLTSILVTHDPGSRRKIPDSSLQEWTSRLNRAGFTIVRTVRRCHLARLSAAAPCRVQITTTGMPGERVTEVRFPDHILGGAPVGGTIRQHNPGIGPLTYTATSTTGKRVELGPRADRDDAIRQLAYHWSLPTEDLRPVPVPEPDGARAAAQRARAEAKPPVTTTGAHLRELALKATELSSGRRPHADTGSATLAAALRVAAVIWNDTADALDVRAPWLNDHDQLTRYLAEAHAQAHTGGFHTTEPAMLARMIADDLAPATGDHQ